MLRNMVLRWLRSASALLALLALCGCAAGMGAYAALALTLALVLAGCTDSAVEALTGSAPDTSFQNLPDIPGTPVPDTGVDVGPDGQWERCCENGQISTCFCPAGLICNFGWFTDCGNGTCTWEIGAEVCPDSEVPDTGIVDTGPEGTWEPCCENGRISTCFCPVNWSCNYGWFNDCGNDVCVFIGDECP